MRKRNERKRAKKGGVNGEKVKNGRTDRDS